MSNRAVKEEMYSIYGRECMLTSSPLNLSYHHIFKAEFGGKNTVSNGAIICREAHNLLHELEHSNRALYELMNECLQLYKICRDKGNEELTEQYDQEVKPKVKRLIR